LWVAFGSFRSVLDLILRISDTSVAPKRSFWRRRAQLSNTNARLCHTGALFCWYERQPGATLEPGIEIYYQIPFLPKSISDPKRHNLLSPPVTSVDRFKRRRFTLAKGAPNPLPRCISNPGTNDPTMYPTCQYKSQEKICLWSK
jgi:hypothetical protein